MRERTALVLIALVVIFLNVWLMSSGSTPGRGYDYYDSYYNE